MLMEKQTSRCERGGLPLFWDSKTGSVIQLPKVNRIINIGVWSEATHDRRIAVLSWDSMITPLWRTNRGKNGEPLLH